MHGKKESGHEIKSPKGLAIARAYTFLKKGRYSQKQPINYLAYLTSCSEVFGVSRMDRVGNNEVRRRAGIKKELATRADLRWFGHVERMDEYRMARSVLMAEISEGRVRGRPRFGWMDGVKVALGNRGMAVEAVRQCGKIGKSEEPWYISN